MDIFMEKIVARRKTGKDHLITAGIIVVGFIAVITAFSVPVLSSFGPILAAAIIYFAFYFSKSRNIEFEYAVTNGELDIDRIIAQRKRKRIFSGSAKELEIMAKLKSDKYTTEYKNISKRIEAVSSMDAADIYFIVATYKGERTIVFFEPEKRMIDSFRTSNPRKVFEW